MDLKQKQKHPAYPNRGSEDEPIYFTHKVVIDNICNDNNPNGWADPFWNNMNNKEKIKILSKVPMSGPFESRNFDKNMCILDYDYSGPLNPKGYTGMIGRGLLGCYGPNYAADPIVTRFNNGVLEMAAIQRTDTKEWAIPGGMVNKGDTVSETLKKEFNEEALGNTLSTGDLVYKPNTHDCSRVKTIEDNVYVNKMKELKSEVDKLFKNGTTIYKGWVDDPRNTDWAWMETVAVHFHIEEDSPIHNIELRPATDAIGAKWYKIENKNDLKKLYASHGDFVIAAIKKCIEMYPNDIKWSNVYLDIIM